MTLALALSGLASACGRAGSDVDATSGGCVNSDDCDLGAECSAGVCVAVQACVGPTDCGAEQTCAEGVCRTSCTSDTTCESLGLRCDLALGLCVPKPTDSTGTGGSGSGGSGSGGGSGGTPPVEGATEVIDDLEDGDVKINATASRVGYWYSYNEETARPRLASSVLVDGGGSKVLHASGSHKGGVAADAAYGGLGVDLNNADPNQEGPLADTRLSYDASDWDGFQFRIRSSVTKSIRFEIVTNAVATSEEGGSCSGDGCFDAYGMDVPLSEGWTTVQVPFASLVQEGWGQQKTFDAAGILGVAFEDLSTGSWDFCVDDLAFFTEPEVVDPGGGGDPGGGDPTCSGSWGEESNGSVTWYTFSQGTAGIGDVNCSYGISQNPDKVNHVQTGGGTFFGAINTTDYNTAAACGACVEVSRDNGKKVVVTVVDQCPVASNPKCVKGHIDLSKAAFLELGVESEGYVGERAGKGKITWKYVPCTTTAKVSFKLKEPSNANWNMILVEDHVYPIASVQVQVGGDWLNASRSEYNYWLPPGGRLGSSPYKIRAVDVNGAVLEGSVTLSAGDQSTGSQFTCE